MLDESARVALKTTPHDTVFKNRYRVAAAMHRMNVGVGPVIPSVTTQYQEWQ